MTVNYDSVRQQLATAGLIIDRELIVGKLVRCKIDGDRERKGWYLLRDWVRDDGSVLLVGSFGVWQGTNNNAQKIELDKSITVSAEQAAALKARLAEDRKKAAAYEKAVQTKAAARAEQIWRKCEATGESDYLARKGVPIPYGVKFTETGAVVVPMMDTVGRVHGLQFILNPKNTEHKKRIGKTGRDKEFWPKGLAKKGHFHLIGMPVTVCLVAEGYATGASLHLATGLPVVIAFDAGNLLHVTESIKKRYPSVNFLICADDDRFGLCTECKERITDKTKPDCPHCGKPHQAKNTGIEQAALTALATNGAWIAPRFANENARQLKFEESGKKISDFNDLHDIEGLHTVRVQIEDKLRSLGWVVEPSLARPATTGGEGNGDLQKFENYEELLKRFILIYGGGGTVFDRSEHTIVKLSDMRDACKSKEIARRWQETASDMVRQEEVGFDPTEKDTRIKCNLWSGWPTVPKAGKCDVLLELLDYLCSEEEHPYQIREWILKWLAYPIQHPGAKMKTAVVMHGPQGAGKNMFFEAIASIYGRYGMVVDQDAVEDKYNSLFSAKLFLIADEVVARQELYHTKNKLKGFITGDTIRINPKNIAARSEKNQVNVVFLSNEGIPLVLEEDDRRHAVVWTPNKLEPAFYEYCKKEIDADGIAALHDYLLNLDLSGFAPHTLPPMTKAKSELIDMSLNSTKRFWKSYLDKEIDGIVPLPCLAEDLYELYRVWCNRQGIKSPVQQNSFLGELYKRKGECMSAQGQYLAGATKKIRAIVYPKGQFDHPVEDRKIDWHTRSIDAFSANLKDYKTKFSL